MSASITGAVHSTALVSELRTPMYLPFWCGGTKAGKRNKAARVEHTPKTCESSQTTM